MAKKQRKAEPLTSLSLDDAFTVLLKEGRKEAKRQTTMGEARVRRETRTAHNILHVKKVIADEHERVMQTTLRRDHISAIIATNTCPKCHSSSEHVSRMDVWSKGRNSEGADVWRINAVIQNSGSYDFHDDLPIQINKTSTFNVCPACVKKDAELRRKAPAQLETTNV